ncbi:hypothetical protein [Staphylococcus xylosus]|uniref:hypothetical protein n=1 Tax=Staphylococcus xylosus TaxID=1288 RepID=UPI001E453F95|nr:hypothetical protein [Staphylococcus xylosus]MCD8851620.1 hypothetical protein [Staphylococcus xylosus]
MWIGISEIKNGVSNDYFTGTMTIIAAIIAVLGVILTIVFNNAHKRKELLDNLDSKSEWRKQLYDVASKTFLTTDDVYRVLASLRYFPHEIINEDKAERYFHKATQTIYSDLYSLIVEHRRDIELNKKNDKEIKAPLLTFNQSENVRIYTKFLLKHHWEYNKDKKAFIPKKEKEVWSKTKNLIALDEDKYFKEVTKFKKQTKFIMCDYIFKSIFKLCKQLKK